MIVLDTGVSQRPELAAPSGSLRLPRRFARGKASKA